MYVIFSLLGTVLLIGYIFIPGLPFGEMALIYLVAGMSMILSNLKNR